MYLELEHAAHRTIKPRIRTAFCVAYAGTLKLAHRTDFRYPAPMIKLIAPILLASVIGCASSTAETTAATCGVSENPKVTEVTKVASSDMSCPSLTVAELNAADPDAGGSSCTPKYSTTACTFSVDCTDTDANATTTQKGVFVKTADGTGVTGTLAVGITPTGAAKINCAYTITMK